MVAADRTGQTSRNADKQKRARLREDIRDDGNQDAEGAPARAGGKGQEAGDNKDDRRQEAEEPSRRGFHQTGDIELRAQEGRHALQAGGHGQDQDGGHHGDKALGHALHAFLERQNAAGNDDQGDDAAPRQADEGVSIGKGCDEIAAARAAEEAAGIDEANDARDDEDDDGEDQVQHPAPLRGGNLLTGGDAFRIADEVAVLCLDLEAGHLAVVKAHEADGHDEDQRQQGIEVEGDGLDKQLQAGILGAVHAAGDSGGPGGDRRDHADRRRRGVDQIRQLDPGDLLGIRQRTHDGADGQAVEIVVDEDQNAQQERRNAGAGLGLEVCRRPAAKGLGAARLIDQRDDDAQDHQEDENARAIGDGGNQAIVHDGVHRAGEVVVAVHQATQDDADEQGGVDLLRDERQGDGDDRRDQGPERAVYAAAGRDFSRAFTGCADKLGLFTRAVICDGNGPSAFAFVAGLHPDGIAIRDAADDDYANDGQQ